MADVTLSDGREIVFDLTKITVKEYRLLFDPKQPDAEGDALMARISGLTVDDLANLNLTDNKRLWSAFFRRVREPLASPNSVSASTGA